MDAVQVHDGLGGMSALASGLRCSHFLSRRKGTHASPLSSVACRSVTWSAAAAASCSASAEGGPRHEAARVVKTGRVLPGAQGRCTSVQHMQCQEERRPLALQLALQLTLAVLELAVLPLQVGAVLHRRQRHQQRGLTASGAAGSCAGTGTDPARFWLGSKVPPHCLGPGCPHLQQARGRALRVAQRRLCHLQLAQRGTEPAGVGVALAGSSPARRRRSSDGRRRARWTRAAACAPGRYLGVAMWQPLGEVYSQASAALSLPTSGAPPRSVLPAPGAAPLPADSSAPAPGTQAQSRLRWDHAAGTAGWGRAPTLSPIAPRRGSH